MEKGKRKRGERKNILSLEWREEVKIFLIRSLQNVLLGDDFNRLLVALIRWCIKPEQNSLLRTMWRKWIGKLNGERRVREQSLPRSCHRALLPLTSPLS